MLSEPVAARTALSRRTVLAAALAALVPGVSASASGFPSRIVSLDYGIASTLLAIGVVPVGIADAEDWKIWMVQPDLPASVADVGDDLEVNFEALVRLKPDLIFSTPYLEPQKAALENIAPVVTLTIYAPDGDPLMRSVAATRAIGDRLGRQVEAERFLAEAEAAFEAFAVRIARISPPPVALVTHLDDRHARVYGGHSLYDNVLQKIGVRNAWTGTSNFWGFETIGLETLSAVADDARLISFEPLPPDIANMKATSPLWQNLPFVAAGRVSVLPGVLMFGMLPSALRFAELLTDHLESLS
ncbi:ABC transporter substrate-binding protein [Sinorhizobium sp. BG8]|uniref:ABC transporter substrate-binding protein n=1 Tax=Sinorhizobium sp. BG8 TaxID=2613773 RepID=UPI00193DB462|nr:ABC transporter substrate-binding protein [Sinorhizobium sp. BG8]QRM56806.1 ABC transporter substrate-binding protein [Sinorhizobium sp. BG8]